jgi:aminoglycoside/choline kinase family phosphotransferase
MSADRDLAIAAFLARHGWADAQRTPLAGDASNRRYERLTHGPDGQGALLMDAPPETGEDIAPFLAIARHLASIGLSAPHVLASDAATGLVLLEDFGERLFSTLLIADQSIENRLYSGAIDALLHLHASPPPPVAAYGPDQMVALAGLACDWYGLGATGLRDARGKHRIAASLADAFDTLPPWTPVLALRDFHADNLFWLPERQGPARVGLIDFQDAALGHPVYDLVSLARDARRDVAPATVRAMLSQFSDATTTPPDHLAHAFALLAVQRNLRILGVFARLSLHFGKPRYVDLIQRVWRLLIDDLEHPALLALRAVVQDTLPEPTPVVLRRLKDRCGTIPTL